MTRDHDTNRSNTARARRVGAALMIAAIASVSGLVATATEVDAARRTKSTVIAAEAEQAVAAFDRWSRTQNPVDYVRFVQGRDQAAALTEQEIELADGALTSAWSQVSIAKQQAILSAVSQLGVPYESLASEPGVGFDCSGLTIWAFGEAGVELPRISRDQINDAERTDRDDAEAGDLVYYPGHISIYLGADTMVHSPNSGSHVEVGPLPSKPLRFGDAAAAQRSASVTADSLMDRALAISE